MLPIFSTSPSPAFTCSAFSTSTSSQSSSLSSSDSAPFPRRIARRPRHLVRPLLLLIRIHITLHNQKNRPTINVKQNLPLVLQGNLNHLRRFPILFACSYTYLSLHPRGNQMGNNGWYPYKVMYFSLSHVLSSKSRYKKLQLCCLCLELAQPGQSRFVRYRLRWNTHPYL